MAQPYLQVFTNRRIAVTLFLMFASSFPLPLTGTGSTFQVWLTRDNVNIKTIGLLALVGLPYNFKFVWAPLLDRYAPPFLNRRTGWIFVFCSLLMVSIGSFGFFRPSEDIKIIVMIAFAIAFFSASQDIVIDAYRVDLLRPEERGAGAAMVMLGGRLAYLAAGALALILSDHMSWQAVFLIMAACLSVGLISSLFAPDVEKPAAPPKSLADAVAKPFQDFFKRPGSVEILLFVVFYKLADTLAGALLSSFLVSLQFTNTDIGAVNKVFGLIASLVGAVIAGGVVSKVGVYRSLWVFGILQAVSNLVFVGLAYAGKSYSWMVASIAVEQLCGGMGTAAFVAYLIGLCNKRFSATQYALLSSLMAVSRTMLSSGTGFMVAYFGWPKFFIVTAFLAIPGLLLLKRIGRYESEPMPA